MRTRRTPDRLSLDDQSFLLEDTSGLLPPHLLTPVLTVSLVAVAVWMIVTLFTPSFHILLPYHSTAIMVLGVAILVARRGHTRTAAAVFVLSVWALVQLPPFVMGRLDVPGVILPVIAILAAGLLWSTRAAMVLAALTSLVWLLALWAFKEHLLHTHPPRSASQFWLILTESLVVVSVFLHVATRALKEALWQARGSANQIGRLMRDAPDAIVILDRDGIVRAANSAAEALVGVPRGHLVGTELLTALPLPEDTREAAREATAAVFRGEPVDPFEGEVPRPDGGSIHVEATSHRVPWKGDPCLEVILRDITVRRRLERERMEMLEQMTVVQKMEAVGQLAGGVAHDFNNLLAVMGGCADLIAEEPGASDSIVELAAEISQAQRHASLLTRQLLAFAQRQVVNPRPLSLGDHVASRRGLLEGIVGDGVSLDLRIASGDTTVMADAHELEQILINLTTNARDAMDGTGTLSISVREEVVEHELHGAAGVASPGRYAVLEVVDEGCGIAEEHMTRIFEPFFSTRSEGSGSGLGLSAVLGIVRMAGGQVQVVSRPGAGTEMRVYLLRWNDGLQA